MKLFRSSLRTAIISVSIILISLGVALGNLGSNSVVTGTIHGAIVGITASLSIAVIILAISMANKSQIRKLQWLYMVIMCVSIATRVFLEDSLVDAVVFGFFLGNAWFSSLIIVISLFFIIYSYGKKKSRTTAS
jgi:hypothetical protein